MLEFFFEGLPFYKSLRQHISAATQSIDIDVYYYASDKTGWELAELLKKKAKQHVKVRLLCDKLGSQSTSSEIFDDLRENGVEVKFYNPVLTPQRPSWHRNHRKMMIIDRKTAFLGGFNIASEYFVGDTENPPWRDTGVKIEFPDLIEDLTFHFGDVWNHKRLSLKSFWYKRRTENTSNFHIASSKQPRGRNGIRAEYLRAIRGAKKFIYITNPYFVPDKKLRVRLALASRLGADVKILTAGKSDVRLVQWASQSTYSYLLKAGVKIYEYSPRVLHAKSAVIDNNWFTVGSSNLDYLSFFRNLEINLFGRDLTYAQKLTQQFDIDLSHATPITLDTWKQRPWWQKTREKFFYLFRKWL